MAEMTDVYDKAFTEEDVNAIYAYQMSPVGRKARKLRATLSRRGALSAFFGS